MCVCGCVKRMCGEESERETKRNKNDVEYVRELKRERIAVRRNEMIPQEKKEE